MARVRVQDVIVSNAGEVTRASRAHIKTRTGITVPANASAELATELLAAKKVTARVVTWANASNKQREAAAAAKVALKSAAK